MSAEAPPSICLANTELAAKEVAIGKGWSPLQMSAISSTALVMLAAANTSTLSSSSAPARGIGPSAASNAAPIAPIAQDRQTIMAHRH